MIIYINTRKEKQNKYCLLTLFYYTRISETFILYRLDLAIALVIIP